MLTCDCNKPVLMMQLRAGLSGSSEMAKVGTPGASTVTGFVSLLRLLLLNSLSMSALIPGTVTELARHGVCHLLAEQVTPTCTASLSAATLQPRAPHRQLGYYWHCWRKMMSLRNFRATAAGREIGPQLVFLLLLGSRAHGSSQQPDSL